MLCLDAFAAWLGGWRPYGAIEWIGASGLLLLSLGGLLGFAIRRWIEKRQNELLLLLAGTLAGLAIVEGGAYLLPLPNVREAFFHTRGPNLHHRITPNAADIFGIEGVSRFQTDAQGIRRAPREAAPDAMHMLAIGGSTTECVYLDDTETWPELVAQDLGNVWIGNVGISGFDTRDHLRFVRESRLLSGVHVLLVQPGINDYWRYLAAEEEVTQYDRFKVHEPAAERPAVAPAPSSPPPRAPLWTRARSIQLYHHLRRRAPDPKMREGSGGEEYRIRREMRRAAEKTGTLPDLTRGLEEYEARLRAIIEACRERGVTPVFLTQPVLWSDRPTELTESRCWFGWLPNGHYLTLPALRSGMDAYNARLLALCRELNVTCVDLAAMQGVEAYFYDDCHFTEAGARAVADATARTLRESGVLKPPAD
ncbi:MAG: SGNH/GDSL hydrolase family protein [Candidatus Hydrogenedentes bacterium]|nr:SGNH/GDSL hydrolase family protein [Candidatus Hydrogenedentota bacterium]